MSVVELGQLAGLVEVAEPVERFEGAVVVIGEVEAVELLECLPAGFKPWVGSKRASRRVWSALGGCRLDVAARTGL